MNHVEVLSAGSLIFINLYRPNISYSMIFTPMLLQQARVGTAQVAPEGWRHGGGETGSREAGLGHAASLHTGQGGPVCRPPEQFHKRGCVLRQGAVSLLSAIPGLRSICASCTSSLRTLFVRTKTNSPGANWDACSAPAGQKPWMAFVKVIRRMRRSRVRNFINKSRKANNDEGN